MSEKSQQASANRLNPTAITMRWSSTVVSRAASGAPSDMNTPVMNTVVPMSRLE